MQNNFLSEREGRALFDEVIMVEVISPGSRDSTPVFEVVRKFAPELNHNPGFIHSAQYAVYKSFIEDFEKNEDNDTSSMAGTPLSQWPEMTRVMAASLKAQNIFTVDALASLPDTKLIAVGPDGRTWREKAKAYIESAKGNAYSTALAADLERAKADLVEKDGQIKELAAQIAALQAAVGGLGGSTGAVTPPPLSEATQQAPEVAQQPSSGGRPKAVAPATGSMPII